MSVRSVEQNTVPQRSIVFDEIAAQRSAEVAAARDQTKESMLINAVGALDGLNEIERSAAKLGVSADEWKPISFLNRGHYGTLLKGNALSGPLAQKLEAYKKVAGGDGETMAQ